MCACLTSDNNRLLMSGRLLADAAEYTHPYTDRNADSSQNADYTEHYTDDGSCRYCGQFRKYTLVPGYKARTQFISYMIDRIVPLL